MPEQCRVPAIGAALILAAYMASPPDPACVFRGSSPGDARYCRIEDVGRLNTFALACMKLAVSKIDNSAPRGRDGGRASLPTRCG
jgi:hypothetical protein